MAYLLLSDGTVFAGESFGAKGTRVGELVFTTGMTGTAESLTDPSYAGQMICFTFPQLGNYGIAMDDCESEKVHASAVIVREYCDLPSNFRCEKTVGALLEENGVVGISGVDTRRITQIIREHGVMNAAVTDGEPTEELLERVRAYSVQGVVAGASVAVPVCLPCPGARFSVALMDYGYKKSIADCLIKRGCAVTVYPHGTSAEEILAAGHDGVMLSNGPGDPAENVYEIAQIKAMMGRIPVFGICLGHQMMALAQGAQTGKMKFGHRGANQPAKAPANRPRLRHQPEPRLRRRGRFPGRHAGGAEVRERQRRLGRGSGLPRAERLLRAVPPRVPRRPARQRGHVRPLYSHAGR